MALNYRQRLHNTTGRTGDIHVPALISALNCTINFPPSGLDKVHLIGTVYFHFTGIGWLCLSLLWCRFWNINKQALGNGKKTCTSIFVLHTSFLYTSSHESQARNMCQSWTYRWHRDSTKHNSYCIFFLLLILFLTNPSKDVPFFTFWNIASC